MAAAPYGGFLVETLKIKAAIVSSFPNRRLLSGTRRQTNTENSLNWLFMSPEYLDSFINIFRRDSIIYLKGFNDDVAIGD